MADRVQTEFSWPLVGFNLDGEKESQVQVKNLS